MTTAWGDYGQQWGIRSSGSTSPMVPTTPILSRSRSMRWTCTMVPLLSQVTLAEVPVTSCEPISYPEHGQEAADLDVRRNAGLVRTGAKPDPVDPHVGACGSVRCGLLVSILRSNADPYSLRPRYGPSVPHHPAKPHKWSIHRPVVHPGWC